MEKVTILILIDGFLQYNEIKETDLFFNVTILILIDGFLQYKELFIKLLNYRSHNPYFNRWFSAICSKKGYCNMKKDVTILILIDGFLQCNPIVRGSNTIDCHNPYFNRWFSAILSIKELNLIHHLSHNPYFNRWFSAISFRLQNNYHRVSHNPYFNRWFSAMNQPFSTPVGIIEVTILILIDGFLQYEQMLEFARAGELSQSLF